VIHFSEKTCISFKLLNDQGYEKILEIINSNEKMEMTSQITASMEYSKKLDIDAETEFARYHRTRRPPRRLDDNPETTAVQNY
jgi:hypothetical protein